MNLRLGLLVWIMLWGAVLPAQESAGPIRTVHVYVALCDNVHQGIAPVSARLGNGQAPNQNLYWGAAYGLRTYLTRQGAWEVVNVWPEDSLPIRERVLFRHTSGQMYLLAEAYDGAAIEACTQAFLQACSGQNPYAMPLEDQALTFGGGSDLLVYLGHNGLMDFNLDLSLSPQDSARRQAIILSCYSQMYFRDWLQQSGAEPLLWTTGLMAPEAYVLAGALEGWQEGLAPVEIRRLAAEQYHRYQGCGMRAAWNLFRHGWE